jgi:hypothetical protein
MTPPQASQPRQRRDSVRYQAGLDVETQATLEDWVKALQRKRGQILRYVMQWGLAHGKDWTIDQSLRASVHPDHMLLEPESLHRVGTDAPPAAPDCRRNQPGAGRRVVDRFTPSEATCRTLCGIGVRCIGVRPQSPCWV